MATANNRPTNNNKKKSILLNWRLWLALFVALALVLAGVSMAYGPLVVQKLLTDPATGAVVAVFGAAGGLAYKFFAPIFEAWKERLEKAEKKASLASSKSDVALAATGANTQRSTELEEQMRLFKLNQDNQQHYIDDLQQQRESDKAEIADLRVQLRAALKEIESLLREIAELKTQLREVNRESLSDKQEITLLRAKVSNLEMEVAKLIVENAHLLDENRELKLMGGGRRSTDKLQPPDLPPDMQKAFDEYKVNLTTASDKKDTDKPKGES